MTESAPVLRLDPALDLAAFAPAYVRDGVVRVPDLFGPRLAETPAPPPEKMS